MVEREPQSFADLVRSIRGKNDPLVLGAVHDNLVRLLDRLYGASETLLGGSQVPFKFADPVDEQVTCAVLLLLMTLEDDTARKYPQARMDFTCIMREMCRDPVHAFNVLVRRKIPVLLLKVNRDENEKDKRDSGEPPIFQNTGTEGAGAYF
jgi:hypothetical protein